MKIIDQENRTQEVDKEGFDCGICGNKFVGHWTDLHGQATCSHCGCPYQLVPLSKSKKDTKFPHLALKVDFIPIFKEYWEATKQKCRLGAFFLRRSYPGLGREREQIDEWLKEHHPEWL